MTLLQHHILALWLTALSTGGLGLLVFLAGPKKRLNQVFGLYSLAITWWALFESLFVGVSDRASADLLAYLEWPGVMFIAPTFFHTVCLLVNDKSKASRIVLRIAYTLTVFLEFAHLGPNLVIAGLRPVAYTALFSWLTPLGLPIPCLFFLLVNVALFKLYCAYRVAAGQRRTQLCYLLVASVIGYLGGSADWLLIFGLALPPLNPFGIYCVPLYSLATTYAVFQHRLLDVDIVIRKSVVYSLLVSLLTIGYFGSMYFLERVFQVTFGYSSIRVSLAAFAAMALLFQPLKVLIQHLVDRLIFRAPQQTVAKKLEVYEERAREGDRYKAVATLATGIAHELKNPLTSIKTFLEFFPERHGDPEFREQFQAAVGSAVGRLEQITHGLLDFSKPHPLQAEPVDLKAVLDDVLALTYHELQKKALTVTTAYTHNGSTVQGDASKLKQVFLNLILNAKEAMVSGGTLTVFTGAVNGHLEVHIADTGRGIHPKDIPHLFEPFFSKKAGGHGLGLSIVQGIVREHHGTITVHSTPGRGTTFTVRLPVSAAP